MLGPDNLQSNLTSTAGSMPAPKEVDISISREFELGGPIIT